VQAAPFDVVALAIQGAPVAVLDTAETDGAGVAQLAVATSGALVQKTTAERDDRRGVLWRWGSGPPTTVAPPFDVRALRAIVASPDGARGAAAVSNGHRADIWVWNLDRAGDATDRRLRLTAEGQNAHPVWTPDGATVVYGARVDERFELGARAADGSSPAVRLAIADRSLVPTSVSADGQLLYTRTDANGMDVWRLTLQRADGVIVTGSTSQPLIGGRGDQREAAWSPDGRWLAWQSNASGSWRVVARNVRGSAVDHDLGASLGGPLFWAESTLAFQTDASTAALVRVGPDVIVDRTTVRDAVQIAGLVPSRGGLLWRAAAFPIPTRLEVVLEWTKELAGKVPVRPKDVKAVR
jgi:hypothetical protein